MDDEVVGNGVDADSGEYAVSPLSVAALAARIRGSRAPEAAPPENAVRGPLGELRVWNNLRNAGWAVVFPRGTQDAVRGALEPLLARRRRQAGARFRVLEFDPAVDTFRGWLSRHDVGPGDRDTSKVPYYLLLVGPPTAIPFEVQYLLDVEYAVGRVDFSTNDEFAAYARGVVEQEDAEAAFTAKEVVYWAPRRDRATMLSADGLVAPLVHGADGAPPPAVKAGFRTTALVGASATKEALLAALHRPPEALPPALLFTASHGIGYAAGDPRQRARQGALLSDSWPGRAPVRPEDCVAASDLSASARVRGTVAFHFACFGAGAPAVDAFRKDRSLPPAPVAPEPFVAALPQRLLAHPNGAALAVVGHVDRAWGYSFHDGGRRRIGPFSSFVERVLAGMRVGLATHDFSQRFASLAAALSASIESSAPDGELVRAWLGCNDARSYVLLGDPAVRLRPDILA